MKSLVASMSRLKDDTRGVSIVEFAFSLPFLILLYIGGYQLTDAISAYRKVTTATRTIADLSSQYTSVYDSDLDTVLNASQQVMAPYSSATAKMLVSQIKTDGSGNSTVDWSRGKNIAPLTPSSSFVLPASIKQNNTSLIVAQINYDYVPKLASSLIGTIPLSETIIMSPRRTESVEHLQ